jgi:hypothetical protein
MILSASVFGVTRNGFQAQTYSVNQSPWASRDLADTFYGKGQIIGGEGVYLVNLRDVTAHFYIRSAGILSSTENARPNAMFGICVETSCYYLRDPQVFGQLGIDFLESHAPNLNLVVRTKATNGTDQFAFAVGSFADSKGVIKDALAKLVATLDPSFDRADIVRSRASVKIWQPGFSTRTCTRNDLLSIVDVEFDKVGSLYVPLRDIKEAETPPLAEVVKPGLPIEKQKTTPSKSGDAPMVPGITFKDEEDRANEQPRIHNKHLGRAKRLRRGIKQLRICNKRLWKVALGLAVFAVLQSALLVLVLLAKSRPGEESQTTPVATSAPGGQSSPPQPASSHLGTSAPAPPTTAAPAVAAAPSPVATSLAAMTANDAQQCKKATKDNRTVLNCYLSDQAVSTIVSNFETQDLKSASELFSFIGKITAPSLAAPADNERGLAIAKLNPNTSAALDALIAARRNGTSTGFATFNRAKPVDMEALKSELKGVLLSSQTIPAE